MAEFVTTTDQPTTIDFQINMPYSIDGDGKSANVEIMNYTLSASYMYFTAPKLDKDAFLLARVSGWSELNLLPGSASVYFEGNYVGNSTINPSSTEDTLDLSLGRDKRIIITRELKKEFSQTRFTGSNVVKEFMYEINIKNTKKDNIQLVLEDQFPVSKNSEIKVTLGETSGASVDQMNGKLTWRMEMEPSATEKRTLSYQVKYPKDKPVQGLR
jgi:uncharacterized protein (TIGR02231 family)